MTAYHNTTNLTGNDLQQSIKAVKKQDAVILEIYSNSSTALSPSDVLKYCDIKGYSYPLTSVRRSINTLTNGGELIHTAFNKTGMYGKPEGLWLYFKNSI